MVQPFLYVARHGETDYNRAGRLQGHTDVDLNALGREQARALGARAKGLGIVAIGSSDLSRARETCAIAAGIAGARILPPDHRLRERSFGALEGLTYAECEARYGDAWWSYRKDPRAKPPGGEAWEDCRARVDASLRAIHEAETPHGPVLVVAHGAVIRAFVFGETGKIDNGAIYRVSFGADGAIHMDQVVGEHSARSAPER